MLGSDHLPAAGKMADYLLQAAPLTGSIHNVQSNYTKMQCGAMQNMSMQHNASRDLCASERQAIWLAIL